MDPKKAWGKIRFRAGQASACGLELEDVVSTSVCLLGRNVCMGAWELITVQMSGIKTRAVLCDLTPSEILKAEPELRELSGCW